MELQMLSEDSFKYHVKGESVKSEGMDAYTLGFKDGIAVVEYKPTKTLDKTTTTTRKDNADNSKSIDISRLKKIIVKTDPDTGKKFILKDGKRIDIVSQSSPLMKKLLSHDITNKPKTNPSGEPPPLAALTNPHNRKGIIIQKTPTALTPGTRSNVIVNSTSLPQLNAIPASNNVEKVFIANQNGNMKIVDNIKHNHTPPVMKKPTVIRSMDRCDTAQQTEIGFHSRDACTQTEIAFSDERDSPVSDQFIKFILSEGNLDQSTRRMIDPMKPKCKEEESKLNFFNDLRNALRFDRTGNLPIHESVLQNDLKAVQKNCIILSALKENVNILNQQSYTPLHLAIIHDADVEIVKNLLTQGADLRKTDLEGNTAIHLAITNNNPTLLKVLINGLHRNFDFDIHNHEGYTPLILASLIGSYETANLLLQHGADPNIKDMKSGRTALFHAAECQQVDIVELLIQNKADTKIRNFFGTSPHDAMFELDEVHVKIKLSILGRDHVKLQQKRRLLDSQSNEYILSNKKTKLETTPILKKVTTTEMMKTKKK